VKDEERTCKEKSVSEVSEFISFRVSVQATLNFLPELSRFSNIYHLLYFLNCVTGKTLNHYTRIAKNKKPNK
jgi:hypothetical protein